MQAAYPAFPATTSGGWGFMVLTNMLPNQGNGTLRFSLYARDAKGRPSLLGTRTITCDNAHATAPVRHHRHAGTGRDDQGRPTSTSAGR